MLSRTQQISIYLASFTKKKLIYEVIQPIQKGLYLRKVLAYSRHTFIYTYGFATKVRNH